MQLKAADFDCRVGLATSLPGVGKRQA